ncbi:hypothetical protein FQN49_005015 [Arthroderma sp. PD_2]|nr:hypothetical protein FQN49_005015 [Arthroderma sp. PD_2]
MAQLSGLPKFPSPTASQAEVYAFLQAWVAARWRVPVSSQQVQDVPFRFKGTGATLYSLSEKDVQAMVGNEALGTALYSSLRGDSPYGSLMGGKYASVVSGLSNAAKSFGPWIQDPSAPKSSSIRPSYALEPPRVPTEERNIRPKTSSISQSEKIVTHCRPKKPSAEYLNKFYVK